MFRLKCRIARDSSTMNTENAAFSKSVSCTSIGRNSTRQPIGEFVGGGLNRSVCQLVDWMFCVAAQSDTYRKGAGSDTNLEVVIIDRVVLVYAFRENNNGVPNK